MTLTTAPARPTATLCRDSEEFASLAAEWDALRARSRAATPFQSHAWLHSWWLSYGVPGRLRVLLISSGGRLVAAAPLMLVYRPLPTLVTLGGDITDYCDVLLDDEYPQAAEALAEGLSQAARGAVVDLREVRPGGAAERLHRAWRGPRRQLPDSVCLELPAVPIDTQLRRLPTASARRSRQKLRRLEKLDIEERTVAAADVPGAVRDMLRLHAWQWQNREVTPEHLSPRFGTHLERALRPMVSSGDAVLTEYRLDGEVVTSDVSFTMPDLVCGYLYGSDPGLRERKVDVSTMLLRHDLRFASATGRAGMSLLRGTEPYKLRWLPSRVVNQRFLMARREMAPALGLCAAQIAGRAYAAEAVRERESLQRVLGFARAAAGRYRRR